MLKQLNPGRNAPRESQRFENPGQRAHISRKRARQLNPLAERPLATFLCKSCKNRPLFFGRKSPENIVFDKNRRAERPVPGCKTRHFASWNGAFRNAIRTVLESGTALVSKCQAANHFPTSISRGFEVLKFRRQETDFSGERRLETGVQTDFSGDWRLETGVQTNAVQEEGDWRQEFRRMLFRRKEKGDRSSDECCSGGRRKGKGCRVKRI